MQIVKISLWPQTVPSSLVWELKSFSTRSWAKTKWMKWFSVLLSYFPQAMCLLSCLGWWQWLQTMMLLKLHNWKGSYSTTFKPNILVAQNIFLEGTSMTECRPIESPMDQNQKLIFDQGEQFSDLRDTWYRWGNSSTSQSQHLIFQLSLELWANLCWILTQIIRTLLYAFWGISKDLLNKGYYIRITEIVKFWDILTLIRQVSL